MTNGTSEEDFDELNQWRPERWKKHPDLREALADFAKMFFSCLEQTQTECYTAPDMHRIKVGLWAEAIRNPEVFELFEHNYRGRPGRAGGDSR